MMFSGLQGMTIPEGVVTQIAKDGVVLWAVQSSEAGGLIILEVEKITSDTYAGETTYTGEQFILLDIYPKTNGTVKVTYGGLTKTITDTSGAVEPNAQQVYFGTFNGVSDSVTTPASGELTIEGDCVAFACGTYQTGNKSTTKKLYAGVIEITNFGVVEYIPQHAFGNLLGGSCPLTNVTIPKTVKSIGLQAFTNCSALESVEMSNGVITIDNEAFAFCTSLTYIEIPNSVSFIGANAFSSLKTVRMLAVIPPELGYLETTNSEGIVTKQYTNFASGISEMPQIIVPKGCSSAYSSNADWIASGYADYIVEAS